jgi:mannose-6-phosphate isomerase-like protein (cupin superfamily)
MRYATAEVNAGFTSAPMSYPNEEISLICTQGEGAVIIGNLRYEVTGFDMVYIPENTSFQLAGGKDKRFELGITFAPSHAKAAPAHVSFSQALNDPARMRRMVGKYVVIMLPAEMPSQNLVAGYAFFDPHTRTYPPHKHSDQEEIYHIVDGRGAMEVYPSEEQKTFVYSVEKGDIVSIPLEHYHPCFSQEDPLGWWWIIAGERYWIGDRDKNWMEHAQKGK